MAEKINQRGQNWIDDETRILIQMLETSQTCFLQFCNWLLVPGDTLQSQQGVQLWVVTEIVNVSLGETAASDHITIQMFLLSF